jgi:hypothetical protein
VNLISLSLWGTSELYIQGAICNARLASSMYPGWALRVYCSPDVPVLDLLRSLGVDVRIVPPSPGYGGLFWRFLPAADPAFEHVIVRDADSRLNVREKAAVDAWIASGRPFHVMRDHPQHRHTPMLAGMWGCRGGVLPDMPDRIARFARGVVKHTDTTFLREEIWPLVKDRALVHTSVPEPLGGDPFPPHSPFDGFVGEIVDPRAEARGHLALLLPSRGRPDAALATVRSAQHTASAPEHLRIIVGVEPDDADRYGEVFGNDAAWIHVLRAGGNYVRAIRELHRGTLAGIYGLSADDFVFETPGWDRQIRQALTELPERLGLVYADDGIQGERLATAPFLSAEWIECLGDVLPGNYQHMFCDTEVTDIARRAGLLCFLPDVRIAHRHHLAGFAPFDATYERSSVTMAQGRTEFEARSAERQRLADRLIKVARARSHGGRRGGRAVSTRIFPSPAQRLLLTAAVGNADAARPAWTTWASEIGAARADAASVRLFPFAWWRLDRLGVRGVEVDALKPHYMNSWAASHAHLQMTAEVSTALQAAGIPTLLLNGLALAARYYETPPLRPTSRVDLLVARRHTEDAGRCLMSIGWRLTAPVSTDVRQQMTELRFEDRLRRTLRLHPRTFADRVPRTADSGLWARSERVEIAGAPVGVLAPADQLLHVCLRAMRSRHPYGIHWVADVMAVLHSVAAQVDWDLFAAETRARRVVMPVRHLLDYVRHSFEVQALDGVMPSPGRRRT